MPPPHWSSSPGFIFRPEFYRRPRSGVGAGILRGGEARVSESENWGSWARRGQVRGTGAAETCNVKGRRRRTRGGGWGRKRAQRRDTPMILVAPPAIQSGTVEQPLVRRHARVWEGSRSSFLGSVIIWTLHRSELSTSPKGTVNTSLIPD